MSVNTRKRVRIAVLVFLAVLLILGASFFVSPRPGSWLIRNLFDAEARKVNLALEKHLPPKGTVMEKLDISSGSDDDRDSYFDLFYPAGIDVSNEKLPLIIWIHGGGYVSGDKSQVTNYCKILSSHRYVVAALNYSIAPKAVYPKPVSQIMRQLEMLLGNAAQYRADTAQVFLAGDSAGAHMAAQIAALLTNPTYAELLQIKTNVPPGTIDGLLLFCGPYDVRGVSTEGAVGKFFHTVLWAYSGKKHFMEDEFFMTSHVLDYITGDFPPAFISVGNDDFLKSHSHALAQQLSQWKVPIDTLFFPSSYKPPLAHEYQFNLDLDAGQEALRRVIQFIELYRSEQNGSPGQ